MKTVTAREVQPGDVVRDHSGRICKVLASFEDRGVASAAASEWCIVAYAGGYPTGQIRCWPDTKVRIGL